MHDACAQVEEEDGNKFTAFNLKEERETGWVRQLLCCVTCQVL